MTDIVHQVSDFGSQDFCLECIAFVVLLCERVAPIVTTVALTHQQEYCFQRLSHIFVMAHEHLAKWFDLDADVLHIRTTGNATLARGTFGEVRVAIDAKRERLLVVKTIAQAISGGLGAPKKRLRQEVANEIVALRMLNGHDNIVSFAGLAMSSDEMMPSALCLVFEYCPIDLCAVVARRRASLSFDTIRFIAHEILSALRHCHSNGIIHRDVTPKNLLISQRGRIRLCDFGLARPCPRLLEGQTENDTPQNDDSKAMCALYYRPPENLLGGPAVHDSFDMYSCGLVIAELITGRPLFPGKNVLDQLHRTFQVLGTPDASEGWVQTLPDFTRVSFRQYYPQPLEQVLPRAAECSTLLSLLQSLIVLDPRQRKSARVVLQDDSSQFRPMARSALDLIPTECKGVIFSHSSIEIAEEEALSLAASRRLCTHHDYLETEWKLSIQEALQGA